VPDPGSALGEPLPSICRAAGNDLAMLAPCRCTAQQEAVLVDGRSMVRAGDFCGPEFYGRDELASVITVSAKPETARVIAGGRSMLHYRFESCATVPIPVVIRSKGGLVSPIRTTLESGGALPFGQCGMGSSGVDYHLLVVVEPQSAVELRVPWHAARPHGVFTPPTDCRIEERPLEPGRYALEPHFRAVDLAPLPVVTVEVLPLVP
jgi:hypothetical protein